jgi:hypothetical protein
MCHRLRSRKVEGRRLRKRRRHLGGYNRRRRRKDLAVSKCLI